MSIQAVAWALEQDLRDPHQKLILISLANHANHVTGECWPAMRLIAKEASCDRRTVLRKLPVLIEAGYVTVVKASAGNRKRAHVYKLCIGRCDLQSHQTPDQMCLPVTRGCDSVVASKNHHRTITSPLPSSTPRRVDNPNGLGNGSKGRSSPATRSEHASVVQARLAEKLGAGDVSAGWMILGELTDAKRDELTALERRGRLTLAHIAELRLIGSIGDRHG